MTTTTRRINEYTALAGILKDLKAIVARESKRPQGCEDLTLSMLALLEEEIIPQLENEIEHDLDSIQHLSIYGMPQGVSLQ